MRRALVFLAASAIAGCSLIVEVDGLEEIDQLEPGPELGDAGAPDASPECGSDCRLCEGGCCAEACHGDCDLRCSGCACDFTCEEPPGQCEVKCTDGSDCAIDCRGASKCDTVECRSGSRCLLSCSGADCGFHKCDGGETQCAGGIVVCNRACP
jgi:hypothetical protein